MEISNFDYIRAGSGFPASVDVRRIGSHETYGVSAEAHFYRCQGKTNYVQLRKHRSEKVVALFSFSCDDQEVPGYWADSTVVWDSRTDA